MRMRGASVHAAILCTLFLETLATRAHADDRCVVRLDGGITPREWRLAVDAAAHGLDGVDTGDCAEIRITPEASGAMVTFTTHDGRIAQRHIRRPNELRPLFDALTVTVPPAAAPEPEPGPTPLLAITESSPDATVPVEEPMPELVLSAPTGGDDRSTSPAPGRPALLLFVGGGARTDGRSEVTPQGQLGVGVGLGKWELGVIGRIEAEHDLGTKQNGEASSMGVGARLARRERIGPIVLVTGVAMSAQWASVEAHPSRTQHAEVDFLEPRAGAFVGFVGPRVGRFRLRGEVLGELALSQRTGTAELPVTSGLGIGAMFGVETSFLP